MLGRFETSRLLLRPFKENDLEELASLYASPLVMKYVAPVRDLAQTRDRLHKHLKDREDHEFGLFAAVEKASGLLIGRCD
jgi:ribosomal-protein-alanine N-acetyltransferase